jgi:hypothetical protein
MTREEWQVREGGGQASRPAPAVPEVYPCPMGSLVPPNLPQLMIALQPLSRASWAGQLPPVTIGAAFWAEARIVASLVANGQAEYAPPGTVAPPPEPAWTAHGSPGFGAGTSNSSP